tara:strand:+ start:296 stop:421 length:126 start_codon:yes stop_codon:yes gene_type:complete
MSAVFEFDAALFVETSPIRLLLLSTPAGKLFSQKKCFLFKV